MTSNLKGVLAGIAVMLGLCPAVALAQGATTIQGRVTNEVGAPLQGASVTIPALGVGTYSQEDGRYTLTVPAARSTSEIARLVARRIGYQARNVSVNLAGGTVTQDFALTTTPTQLGGVVVTALGVEKEKSQLGTAQQQVSGEQLNTTFAPNVESQLAGKVSGVNIVGNGTQGGTTSITIRGYTSITGNNQPLFVVDGVPVTNADYGTQQYGGGLVGNKDYGNAIQDLNSNDITSLTVLKGPNAAALYGSRAANGAIIITTKRGIVGQTKTDVSTSVSFDRPSRLPDFQNQYGQGSAGEFQWVNGLGALDGNDQSYGPKLDGRLIDQFTGKQQPWVAHPNNVSSFFKTGKTADATVSMSGGTERASARISLSGENVDGIIPNEFLRRLGGLATGQLRAGDHLFLNGTVDYIRNDGVNRPGQGYGNGIMEAMFVWFGRQVDMNALKANWNSSAAMNNGPANREFNWNYSYHNNPYWMMYANPESDTRDRVIINGSAEYQFTNWLRGQLRSGTDTYRYNIFNAYAQGNIELNNGSRTVDPAYNGAFANVADNFTENNTDVLLTANRELMSHFHVTASIGGNRRYSTFQNQEVDVHGITVANIYNVSNAGLAPVNSGSVTNLAVNSAYGDAAVTLNDWWTVEGTARNDWSSTLPSQNNSYFYPSVSTSIVLTDAVPSLKNSFLSYLKLRGGTARVGNDAAAYQLYTTYNGNASKFNGQPLFSLSNTQLNPSLKPEQTVSSEGGIELGFLDNRLTVDASVYDKYTTDEITYVSLPPSTGYGSKLVNAGKIDNKGYEAQLSLQVLQRRDWDWSSTINFSHNRGKVVSLNPGLEEITVTGFQGAVYLQERVGKPFGALMGYGIKRDPASGLPLLDDNGLWQPTDTLQYMGTVQPDWLAGWMNTVRFGRATLSATLDIRRGGKIFSGTNFYGTATGVLASTLKGREQDWDKPGYVINGLIESTGQKNTNNVSTEAYWQYLAYNNIAEPYVYSDSYVKLRELRVGYDLAPNLANMLHASQVNVAIIGRNLWTSTKVPNIDPEFTYQTGNNQGIEYAALPVPRSVGFSVRLTP